MCERGRAAAAADAEDWPGPGVCDRGAGVWDLGGGFAGETAGVWERVGDSDVAGVVGREDIETDLVCMELNREIGEVYDDWEGLYGVGDVEMCAGDGDGVGDTEGKFGISGGVPPSVVASARSWLTCVCSCWASWDFWVYWDRYSDDVVRAVRRTEKRKLTCLIKSKKKKKIQVRKFLLQERLRDGVAKNRRSRTHGL